MGPSGDHEGGLEDMDVVDFPPVDQISEQVCIKKNFNLTISTTFLQGDVITNATCSLCKKRVSDKNQLPSHMKLVHGIKKPYICDTPCGKEFGKSRELLAHKLSVACSNNVSHPCPNMCGKSFPTMEQLQRVHLTKGRCTNKFRCLTCPDKPYFGKKIEKDAHMATHNDKQAMSIDINIPGDETCPALIVTIKVPISSVSQGDIASVDLQNLLTNTILEVVSLRLTAEQAAGFIQSKINQTFK